MMLKVKNLTVEYPGKKILDDVNFEVSEGDWIMIIGPNGAGKTTITNAIAQSLPYDGEIFYKDINLGLMKAAERARNIGVLMQNHYVAYSFTVREVVSLGRYSYNHSFFNTKTEIEDEIIDEALEKTGMKSMEHQSVMTLSGGELQRTFLAQLITQNPSIMILDEPTNHLDMAYQESTFELIRTWLKEGNRAVISVVHDLRLARMFGTKALLLKDGRVYDYGPIDSVMDRKKLGEVYSIDVYGWMKKLNEKWNI